LAAGPRVTFNLATREAIEAGFHGDLDRSGWLRRDLVYVQAKHALHLFDGGAVFATGGLAVERRAADLPPSLFSPGYSTREISAAPLFGAGVELELGRRLSVRGDLQFVMTDDGYVRGSAGIGIPLGRYADRAAWHASRAAVAGGPLEHVRLGQRVWVTTRDGAVVEGDVAERSGAALTLVSGGARTDVAVSDIQRIETTDRIVDGLGWGALAGGVAGGVLGGLYGKFLCESDPDCPVQVAFGLGGIFAAFGALGGAVGDSLRAGRRDLYVAPSSGARRSIVMLPVVTRRGAGAGGVIR
jgi:hypothetical protein